jgi:predicted metal-dependent HD superfamily phosphohydrolase
MYIIEPHAMQLLVSLYNSPQRHYHDLNHINYSLHKLGECSPAFSLGRDEITVLKYAIWFHDAIYSPYKMIGTSNELESADLFRSCLKDNLIQEKFFYENFEERVIEAILETEYHVDGEGDNKYRTTDIMMDIDMAGFAKPYALAYGDSDLIFKEYAFLGYSKTDMMKARIDFLQKLLIKEYIYRTEYFRETHEAKARQNIADIIKATQRDLLKLGPFN